MESENINIDKILSHFVCDKYVITCPLDFLSIMSLSSSRGTILPFKSEGTMTQLSVPRPPTEAQDFTE